MFCLACVSPAGFAQQPPNAVAPEKIKRAVATVCGDSRVTSNSNLSMIRRLASCGIAEVDLYLPEEVQLLSRIFRIRPRFNYFDDGSTPQARTYPIGERESEVLLGVNLVASERSRHGEGWQTAVIGVLAHEWAHAYQYSTALEEKTYLWETHADFLAGWYLGCKVAMGFRRIDIDVFSKTLYSRGSKKSYFDPDDYGRPEVRVSAMRAGFHHGIKWFDPNKLPDLYYAVDEGYVVATKLRN